jgi:formylglycine-generating enzyme required for sulfatase activity
MIGNVAEWIQDMVDNKAILKGGSFLFPLNTGKIQDRLLEEQDIQLIGCGFRCARTP